MLLLLCQLGIEVGMRIAINIHALLRPVCLTLIRIEESKQQKGRVSFDICSV